jgi:tol-pal system protein YbgF
MTLRLLALLCAFSIGCSPALLSPVEQKEPESEEMKERILELQRQARVSEVELDRLRRQVAELEARLSGMESPSSVGGSAPPAPVLDDQLPGDGRADEAPIESSDIAPPPDPEPVAVSSAMLPGDAQELYDRGYTYYHQSLYVDAESAFQQFVGAHPSSELADNALYWIGESRFARADYRGALAAFRETLDRYPEGNKVPDALLKAADCLAHIGDVDGARATYAEVVRLYPASAAAVSAEERRAALP